MLLLGLVLGACDNSVNISPTEPRMPDFTPTVGALRTLSIAGTLATDKGSCAKATILFDGHEISGARVRCQKAQGCARLDLAGVVSSPAGHHTITFKVLRQSAEAQDYVASAIVEVSRDDVQLPEPAVLELEPVRATLQAGDGVSFTIDLWD
jgi:hypothetical protein